VITYPSAGGIAWRVAAQSVHKWCVGIDREPEIQYDSFSETARNCKIKLLLEG